MKDYKDLIRRGDALLQMALSRTHEGAFRNVSEMKAAVGAAEYEAMRAEVERLRALVADTLPFLREAWEACFRGQRERLLSAEERGMGRILGEFQKIADGKPARAPGWITLAESEERVNTAIKWAHDLLGDANEPHPAIQRWCSPGLTAAHGLKAAHAEVERLELERDDYRSKWCDAVGVANECVKGVKAAESRVAELEAIQRIAHVQVDGDGDLWLHLDGGKNYKASVNVSAKFATHRGVVHGGVRQAAEALRDLLATDAPSDETSNCQEETRHDARA